ncbi:hypothetical protein [Fontivita pretiosa]|uniref:hypothetical protein n=1 Tax=Fontivita pretiosa TaxID=2989684 RepID=UPI003D1764A2
MLIRLILGICLLTAPSPAESGGVDTNPQKTSQSHASSSLSALLDAIRTAPEPSQVISAYANAVAHSSEQMLIDQAFVARMVELGFPDLAEAQAASIIRQTSRDGLAWAVLAFANARRGQLQPAIIHIARATDATPNHPFVMRTAAQIVAWYDALNDEHKRPIADAAHQVADIRSSLGSRATFVHAYDEAARAIQAAQTAASTTQPPHTPPPVVLLGSPPDAVAGTFCLPAAVAHGDYGMYDFGFGPIITYLDPGAAYFARHRGGFGGHLGRGFYGYESVYISSWALRHSPAARIAAAAAAGPFVSRFPAAPRIGLVPIRDYHDHRFHTHRSPGGIWRGQFRR